MRLRLFRGTLTTLLVTSVLTVSSCSPSNSPAEPVADDSPVGPDSTGELNNALDVPPPELVQRLSLDISFYNNTDEIVTVDWVDFDANALALALAGTLG